MNKIILMGRLVADPVIMDNNGKRYLSITLAVQKPGCKDKADFIKCVAWHNHNIDFIKKYFKKGNMIAVQGYLSVYTKEENGAKYQGYSVNITEQYFTGEKLMKEQERHE